MEVVLEFCYIMKALHAEMCNKTVFYSSLFSLEVKLNFRYDENVKLQLLKRWQGNFNFVGTIQLQRLRVFLEYTPN